MGALTGKVAIVTGASRGVGRGIALGLGEAGATVYVTGRTVEPGTRPETIGATAADVTSAGGRGIAIRCDHSVDDEIMALIAKVERDEGHIDVLVNNAFSNTREPVFEGNFWEHPVGLWDQMFQVGCRAHYVASHTIAPILVRQGSGLIVNVSSYAGGGYIFNVPYGVGKAAVDRMAKDMAVELGKFGVTALSLWPGVVRTEYIIEARERGEVPFGIDKGESPQLSGRAVAALAADPKLTEKNGQVLIVADVAREYGFTDIDGRQPGGIMEQIQA